MSLEIKKCYYVQIVFLHFILLYINILYNNLQDFQTYLFLKFCYFKEINTKIITQNNELKLKS